MRKDICYCELNNKVPCGRCSHMAQVLAHAFNELEHSNIMRQMEPGSVIKIPLTNWSSAICAKAPDNKLLLLLKDV
jgi:hypothetical protein